MSKPKSKLSEAAQFLENALKEIRQLEKVGVDNLDGLDNMIGDAQAAVREVMDDMDSLLDNMRDCAS